MNAEGSRLDAHVADAIACGDELVGAFVPDFADVIARAARLRPHQPAQEQARREACARELDALDDVALARAARIGGLDELVDSARATAQAHAGAHEPRALVVPIRRARWVAIGVAALGLAAALVLALGLRARVLSPTPEPAFSGASRTAVDDAWSDAVLETSVPQRPRPATRAPTIAPALAPAPLEPVALPRSKPPRVSTRERLAELDRSARAAWKRGELRQAEAALEQLVRSGGRTALADIAWGDLFELARQRKDGAREHQLLRRYLKAFPRGRYADDARAGMCRGSRADAALACWRGYLVAHPEGTWREQARRALAAGALDRAAPAK